MCVHVCVCVCMRVCMCVCMCVCMSCLLTCCEADGCDSEGGPFGPSGEVRCGPAWGVLVAVWGY